MPNYEEICKIIDIYKDSEHPINEVLSALKDNLWAELFDDLQNTRQRNDRKITSGETTHLENRTTLVTDEHIPAGLSSQNPNNKSEDSDD